MSTTYKAKVVTVGNSGVGKTSIIVRMDGKSFSTRMTVSLGASYIVVRGKHDQNDVQLLLWDTVGQERFRSIAPMYIRGSRAAILVFDITNRQSFSDLTGWWRDVKNASDELLCALVVANKTDLCNARVVTKEEGEQFASQIGAIYCETSAKDGNGIKESLQAVIDRLGEALIKEKRGSFRQLVSFGTASDSAVRKSCC